MNNGTAPICPISRSQAVSGMPGLRTPTIVRATDLATALAALKQIAQVLPQVSGLAPNLPIPPLSGNNGPNQDGGGRSLTVTWTESNRTTEMIRVASSDNPDAWVEIERITSIQFMTDHSASTLVWNL